MKCLVPARIVKTSIYLRDLRVYMYKHHTYIYIYVYSGGGMMPAPYFH